jgi:hypothetical protein
MLPPVVAKTPNRRPPAWEADDPSAEERPPALINRLAPPLARSRRRPPRKSRSPARSGGLVEAPQLHATVLSPALLRIVGGDRLRLAVADRSELVGRHALLDEVYAN